MTRQRWPVITAVAAAVVIAVAGLATAAGPGLLRGPAVMNGSARGTGLVMAVAGVPVLVVSLGAFARRSGSARAHCQWLGSAGYLLYNAVLLCLATPFNRLFLLYVASLGLALATVIQVWQRFEPAWFPPPSAAGRERPVAVFIWFIVVGNALVWLRAVVPATVGGRAPTFLDGTGLTTSPTYIQDLAWWLPLLGLAAWWLWAGRPAGRFLVGAGLVGWTLEAVTVAVDQMWGHHADPLSTVATAGGAWLFGVLAVITGIVAIVFLAGLEPRPGGGRSVGFRGGDRAEGRRATGST